MGGELKVDSEFGWGSIFYFEFLLGLGEEKFVVDGVDFQFMCKLLLLKDMCVLLVDDNLVCCFIESKILCKYNCNVLIVYIGVEVIVLVQ